MMFKIVVLCAFVASALAMPAPEDYSVTTGRRLGDCVKDCYDRYESFFWTAMRLTCLAKCQFTGRTIDSEFELKGSAEFIQPDYSEMISRSLGECAKNCYDKYESFFWTGMRLACLATCQVTGRKINLHAKLPYLESATQEISQFNTESASRGYRDCTEECYEKYLNWSPTRTLCLVKCSAFNRNLAPQARQQSDRQQQQLQFCMQFTFNPKDFHSCMAQSAPSDLDGRYVDFFTPYVQKKAFDGFYFPVDETYPSVSNQYPSYPYAAENFYFGGDNNFPSVLDKFPYEQDTFPSVLDKFPYEENYPVDGAITFPNDRR